MTTTVAFLCLVNWRDLVNLENWASPEVMVLAGVALSLSSPEYDVFQYLLTQLAAWYSDFWNVGRVNWVELEIMTSVVLLAILFFMTAELQCHRRR